MSSLVHVFSDKTMSGGLNYFDYEVKIAQETLIPWLEKHMKLDDIAVGDFGCHQGGILEGLRQTGKIKSGQGFDLDAPSIENSPFITDEHFQLSVKDLTQLQPGQYQFDLILIRDVLEHIPNHVEVLKVAKTCLKPGGAIFISFPPYYSAFGGHQQEASNWAKSVPFLHYLPRPWFFKLVKTRDTVYMSAESSLGDMQSVANTRMTLSKAEKAFKKAGLTIKNREYFLLRPEFKIRYGLPALSNEFLSRIPVLREIYTMGVYYLLTDH